MVESSTNLSSDLNFSESESHQLKKKISNKQKGNVQFLKAF